MNARSVSKQLQSSSRCFPQLPCTLALLPHSSTPCYVQYSLRVKIIASELTKEYRRKTNEVIYFLYNVDTSDSMFSATVHCSHIPTAIAILFLCMFRFSI